MAFPQAAKLLCAAAAIHNRPQFLFLQQHIIPPTFVVSPMLACSPTNCDPAAAAYEVSSDDCAGEPLAEHCSDSPVISSPMPTGSNVACAQCGGLCRDPWSISHDRDFLAGLSSSVFASSRSPLIPASLPLRPLYDMSPKPVPAVAAVPAGVSSPLSIAARSLSHHLVTALPTPKTTLSAALAESLIFPSESVIKLKTESAAPSLPFAHRLATASPESKSKDKSETVATRSSYQNVLKDISAELAGLPRLNAPLGLLNSIEPCTCCTFIPSNGWPSTASAPSGSGGSRLRRFLVHQSQLIIDLATACDVEGTLTVFKALTMCRMTPLGNASQAVFDMLSGQRRLPCLLRAFYALLDIERLSLNNMSHDRKKLSRHLYFLYNSALSAATVAYSSLSYSLQPQSSPTLPVRQILSSSRNLNSSSLASPLITSQRAHLSTSAFSLSSSSSPSPSPQPKTSSNTILSTFFQTRQLCLIMYTEMLEATAQLPDARTSSRLLEALARVPADLPPALLLFVASSAASAMVSILSDYNAHRNLPYPLHFNLVISQLVRAGCVSAAHALLCSMQTIQVAPNSVTYSNVLSGYIQRGAGASAEVLLEDMLANPEASSHQFMNSLGPFHTMLRHFVETSQPERAFTLFATYESRFASYLPPKTYTCAIMVQAALTVAPPNLPKALGYIQRMVTAYRLVPSTALFVPILRRLLRDNERAKARSVLADMHTVFRIDFNRIQASDELNDLVREIMKT